MLQPDENPKSVVTKATGKSYILKLENELKDEKMTRKELQKELDEMKAMAEEINQRYIDME